MNAFLRILACLMLLAVVSIGHAQVTYFHNDVSGTPLMATDAAGNVLWKETYRPYGEQINNPSAAANHLWFTGKPYESQSGLVYMGARYYDPVLGRFIGVDPAPFDELNLHSVNRYAYANNNPYKYVDEDGHSPLDVAFLVYDIGKLSVALYTGVGVSAAVADVALSAVGVVSPVPGTGQALKSVRAIDKAADVGRAVDRTTDLAKTADSGADVAKKVHGNSHASTKAAEGYTLRDRDTGGILKYGETARGTKRYSQKYLKENNAEMVFEAKGTKKEMHKWQHEKILEHRQKHQDARPPLNKSDY